MVYVVRLTTDCIIHSPSHLASSFPAIVTDNHTGSPCLKLLSEVCSSLEEAIEDCAVPIFKGSTTYKMLNCNDLHSSPILKEHKDFFRTTPGKTIVTEHYIPSNGNSVKIPPRQIPANYTDEVQCQIITMLE